MNSAASTNWQKTQNAAVLLLRGNCSSKLPHCFSRGFPKHYEAVRHRQPDFGVRVAHEPFQRRGKSEGRSFVNAAKVDGCLTAVKPNASR